MRLARAAGLTVWCGIAIVCGGCVRSMPASSSGKRPASTPSAPAPSAPADPDPAAADSPVFDDPAPDPVAEDSAVESRSSVHPLAELSDEELTERAKTDPVSLGSMILGTPSNARLFNAVAMPEADGWRLVDPHHAWGTTETIGFIQAAINAVRAQYPDSPDLRIGHISAKNGGHLRPHLSHQAGRDVDISFYYKEGSLWYARAREDNLDVEKTWALVRAFITETDVRFVLVDHSVQVMLRRHAERIGEDPEWLAGLFRTGAAGPAIIRHAPGHRTHLHVRFYNPVAEETARRCVPVLVRLGLVEEPSHTIWHRVKKGETLIGLARRYGTTVRAIKRANGLRRSTIIAKKSYRIPRPGLPQAVGSEVVPPRRLPPRPPRRPPPPSAPGT